MLTHLHTCMLPHIYIHLHGRRLEALLVDAETSASSVKKADTGTPSSIAKPNTGISTESLAHTPPACAVVNEHDDDDDDDDDGGFGDDFSDFLPDSPRPGW